MGIIDPEWLANHPEMALGSLRKVNRRSMKGYPAKPGSGPKGETCGTCANLHCNEMANTYFKCRMMHKIWTGGPGTDVKYRSPACSYWNPRVERIIVGQMEDRFRNIEDL